MADPEHVKLLLEGVAGWNATRKENFFKADLREADLRGADLSEANLRRAGLWGADLREANLRRADLWGADLRGADLRGADLWGADLRGPDLRGADLRRADLRGAAVFSTLLPGASNRVEYTDLSFARNLTQTQVNSMQGDSGTKLPDGLIAPSTWPDWRDQLGSEVENDDEGSSPTSDEPAPRVVKFTSPAEFDLIKAKLDILLDPVNAVPRAPSRAPTSPEARDRLVNSVEEMAKHLRENLGAYQNEDANRVHAAEQLARAVKRLEMAAAAGGERLLIPLFHGLVEAIDRAHRADAEALEAMDRELFGGLLDMARKVYAFYPELAESLDPTNASVVPDNPGVTAAELTDKLRELFFGDETRDTFTDKTREFFEAEVAATTPEGVDAEKFKIARLGAIAGEVVRKMNVMSPEQASQLLQVSAAALAIWQLVAPFLGL